MFTESGIELACADLRIVMPSEERQFRVMLEALVIFRQRNRTRGDLWAHGGVKDSLHHLDSKVQRLHAALSRDIPPSDPEVLDDAVDIINYAAFFVRNARDGR